MGRFIVRIFALIGLLTILLIAGAGYLVYSMKPSRPALAGDILLSVDLRKGLSEGRASEGLMRLLDDEPNLHDFRDAVERAGRDPRVKGMFARLGDDTMGLARIQEVRDAIRTFRARGKFAIAFADSFGEFGPGTRPYYLATAFDEIWLQPMGNVGLTGLYAEVPFFKGTFDLLGVTPDLDHRSEYKTAMNSLTETRMTPPHREETEALLASMGAQILRGIAADRKIPEPAVRQAIDRGPLLAEDALQARLVDRLGYRDEALAHARERAGSAAEPTALRAYLDGTGRPYTEGEQVALIYGTGMIQRGSASHNPLAGSEVMAADTVAAAFRAAIGDSRIRAILFRIDSPGGSVVASETIWRETIRARERGKPVIVSMGDTAGSGGYYVAAAADKIVAEPGTLTGSIGVLAGKMVLGGLLQKVGISVDTAQLGANAGMFGSTAPFAGPGRERLEQFLDATYKGFKDRVAAGRNMTAEQVETVAKGRVWSGEEAKSRGLIDALGGMETAIALAKEAAHIAPDAPIRLVIYPEESNPLTRLYDRAFGKADSADEVGASAAPWMLGETVSRLRPVLARLDALLDSPGLAIMPEMTTPR